MSITEFIAKIEDYYGPYKVGVRGVVAGWLQTHHLHSADLQALLKETFLQISGQYNRPPDVGQLKPLLNDVLNEREHTVLSQATAPRLPDTSECVGKEEAARFMSTLMSAIAKGGDPREDEDVRALLRKHGVDAQVQGEMMS